MQLIANDVFMRHEFRLNYVAISLFFFFKCELTSFDDGCRVNCTLIKNRFYHSLSIIIDINTVLNATKSAFVYLFQSNIGKTISMGKKRLKFGFIRLCFVKVNNIVCLNSIQMPLSKFHSFTVYINVRRVSYIPFTTVYSTLILILSTISMALLI